MEEETMTCECGGTKKIKKEVVPFDQAMGLPGVTLYTDVARCQQCDAHEVIIPNLDGLLKAIAREIVGRRARLSPAEVRFLRKVLGWSGRDFAEHMGTSVETVSRWENGATPIGPQADRLLRLMVLTRNPVRDYEKLDLLKNVARAKPASLRLLAKAGASGDWTVKKEAA